jgi:hypothetical protein
MYGARMSAIASSLPGELGGVMRATSIWEALSIGDIAIPVRFVPMSEGFVLAIAIAS